MCGIVGFAGFREAGLLKRMCNSIEHRGPDDEGMFEAPGHSISLGMRRLSIIDVDNGQQPISSEDGRVSIVLNGEIYNFQTLREELQAEGHVFRTRSDTEVVLAAYLKWGLDALQRLNGMFAFAIIDLRGREPLLYVCKDRTGIKPLYYICQDGKLCFGSELKALMCWDGWSRDISLKAIRDYLSLRYVSGHGSMFEAVQKLPSGCFMEFRAGELSVRRWWTPPQSVADSTLSPEEATESVETALQNSVKRHLVSDVPVGAFLSGGIDSGLLVALMTRLGANKVNTFCVGFPDGGDADTSGAAQVASELGTNHHHVECRMSDIECLPDLVWSLDEPIGDPIVIAMYVLAREARKHVKVVLAGEGADEVFGGYEFHRKLVQLAKLRMVFPKLVWQAASQAIHLVPSRVLDAFFNYPGRLGLEGKQKVARLLQTVGRNDLGSLYRESISLFDPGQLEVMTRTPDLLRLCSQGPGGSLDHIMAGGSSNLERLILAQFEDWLSDLILMKTDRLSMAHGLEARVPYLDAEVIDAAAAIPDHLKLSSQGNKWVLRNLGKKLLPPEITGGKKRPFYFPMEKFSRPKAFQDLMRAMLDKDRLDKRGLFNASYIDRLQQASFSDGFLPSKRLFSVIMLEMWFERFAPDASWS